MTIHFSDHEVYGTLFGHWWRFIFRSYMTDRLYLAVTWTKES